MHSNPAQTCMARILPKHKVPQVDWEAARNDPSNVCTLIVDSVTYYEITEWGKCLEVRGTGEGECGVQSVLPGQPTRMHLMRAGSSEHPEERKVEKSISTPMTKVVKGMHQSRFFHPDTADLRKWVCIKYTDRRSNENYRALYPLIAVEIHSSWHEELGKWGSNGTRWDVLRVLKRDDPCFVVFFDNPATEDPWRRQIKNQQQAMRKALSNKQRKSAKFMAGKTKV